MRYSISTFAAAAISLLAFLFMALLITNPTMKQSRQIEMVDFSMIEEMKQPTTKPTPPREFPPKEKKVPPPSTPITGIETSGPEILPPPINGKGQALPNIINQPQIPGVIGIGDDIGSSANELVELVSIQPMYPPIAARDKIEGWVKVEFTVNPLGRVEKINIVDSQPARVFDSNVKRALLKSKFKPLMVDGKAVSQTAVKTYEFKLDNNQ